jgi:hypothetical protein
MLLPFPVLLRSYIQTRKKLALLGLLALGIFITIIQVIRIRTVKNLANYLDSASLIMWSAVENNLGIIGTVHFISKAHRSCNTDLILLVASIPTLAPLFKYYAEKTQKSSTANSRSRSLYALRPSRGTRDGSIPLGSGIDQTTHVYGPSRGPSGDSVSEEFILHDIAKITKTTEVRVSAHERGGARMREASGMAL